VERLRQRGYGVFHEPLLTIRPLSTPRPSFETPPIVVITSRVVFDVLASRKGEVEDLLLRPCYCVGEKTAQAAHLFGFTDIRRAACDSEDLARCLIRQESKKTPVLHIGGDDREEAFYKKVHHAGWPEVRAWPVYKAEAAETLTEELTLLLSHHKLDVALFYSSRTARVFVRLIRQNKLEACCSSLTAIGLSPSVLEALKPLPFKALLAASQPTETDLVTCLTTHVPL
jgi:uroporphyrinogen-III synthase